MTEAVKINPLSAWRRLRLARGGKKRNKILLEVLAAWNLELKPPDQILSELNLRPDDLAFLESMAQMVEGWHPFEFSAGAPGDQDRLARLGLIQLKGLARKIYLTDAGRYLLTSYRLTWYE